MTNLATTAPTAVVIDLDGSPADAAVVGGRDVATDVSNALAAGVVWIQTLTSGVERVAARLGGSNVLLTNGSSATAQPVSEFAIARVFEHAKQLPVLAERQRVNEWDTRWLGDIAGSTITVVGLGPVGTRVARIANALEMHVIGVRRRANLQHEWCHEVTAPSLLGVALSRSDYCVLAPALTDETRNMVSARVLAQAAEGLHLVNVARGEIVDAEALRSAVLNGRITAALDVFTEEPLPSSSPLWDTPGLSVSAHTATLTPSLIDRLTLMVADNVRRFLSGEALASMVDLDLGYHAP